MKVISKKQIQISIESPSEYISTINFFVAFDYRESTYKIIDEGFLREFIFENIELFETVFDTELAAVQKATAIIMHAPVVKRHIKYRTNVNVRIKEFFIIADLSNNSYRVIDEGIPLKNRDRKTEDTLAHNYRCEESAVLAGVALFE